MRQEKPFKSSAKLFTFLNKGGKRLLPDLFRAHNYKSLGHLRQPSRSPERSACSKRGLVAEKMIAFGEAAAKVTTGSTAGSVVKGYRKKVRANRRRLTK
jgi:hypothetical protein